MLVAIAVSAAAVLAGDLESARKATLEELVSDLEKLADWCTKSRLYMDRNRTYEIVLKFDPDHETARKWLRYRKTRHGWVKRTGFKPPRNLDPGLHPTWLDKLAEVGDRFGDRVVAVLEATKGPARVRAAALRDVFSLRPDHPGARRLNGQVRFKGGWSLRETALAHARRRELVRMARAATFNVPEPRRGRLKKWEADLGLRWTEVWETPTWRLVTTCGPGEGIVAARLTGACAEFVESVFDITLPPRPGQIVFLVTSQQDFRRLLTRHPEMTDVERKRCWDLGGAWTPKSRHLFEYSTHAQTRREGCVRQAIGARLDQKYGLSTEHGWAWEGIGLYLSELLTGTKYVTFVHFGKYARDEKKRSGDFAERLYADGANWFELARELLRKKRFPEFRFLLGKNVNVMTAEDLVASYCLGAYVLEAHAERAGKLLEGIGNKELSPHKAFRGALGMELRTVQQRLHAWIGETRR